MITQRTLRCVIIQRPLRCVIILRPLRRVIIQRPLRRVIIQRPLRCVIIHWPFRCATSITKDIAVYIIKEMTLRCVTIDMTIWCVITEDIEMFNFRKGTGVLL